MDKTISFEGNETLIGNNELDVLRTRSEGNGFGSFNLSLKKK